MALDSVLCYVIIKTFIERNGLKKRTKFVINSLLKKKTNESFDDFPETTFF